MTSDSIDEGLEDLQAIEHLLQIWLSYTPHLKIDIECAYNIGLSTIVDGETVQVCKSSEMTVTRNQNEFDVRGERNRGHAVFSIDADGLLLNPTREQLRCFMVKLLNLGGLDKRIYRPLMQDRKRFDLAARDVSEIRGE